MRVCKHRKSLTERKREREEIEREQERALSSFYAKSYARSGDRFRVHDLSAGEISANIGLDKLLTAHVFHQMMP